MYEVLDALGLEVVGAGGSAGHHELGAAVEQAECLGGESGVFVIRGAEHHDVGTLLHGGVDAGLHGVEADIVDNLVAGAAEEVR